MAVRNHESFIWLTLYLSDSIPYDQAKYQEHFAVLNDARGFIQGVFEIFCRLWLKKEDQFEMLPGFENFQVIKKGEPICIYNGRTIESDRSGRIFMPRYQPLGDDGFFGIKRTPKFFLWLSAVLRKLRFDIFLSLLPGIRIIFDDDEILIANKRIARFFPKQVFHLLGYRSRRLDEDRYVMRNRETQAKTRDYKGARCYK